jgi:hypothetical protein
LGGGWKQLKPETTPNQNQTMGKTKKKIKANPLISIAHQNKKLFFSFS